MRQSTAWVGAEADGRLVACARALSDGVSWAGIYDVCVAPAWRRRGVGEAVVRLLLDHPAVRRARRAWLRTRDAQAFYRRFGFVRREEAPPEAIRADEMLLVRQGLHP